MSLNSCDDSTDKKALKANKLNQAKQSSEDQKSLRKPKKRRKESDRKRCKRRKKKVRPRSQLMQQGLILPQTKRSAKNKSSQMSPKLPNGIIIEKIIISLIVLNPPRKKTIHSLGKIYISNYQLGGFTIYTLYLLSNLVIISQS